jgi:hypothetical protein
MKKPLLPTVVADEAESAVFDQPFNRAVRHVAVPPGAISRRPCVVLDQTPFHAKADLKADLYGD